NQFLKDGRPYRYIAGAIHYFRIPKIYWSDRLKKMKASGLNAIQFYIPWNLHEPRPGALNLKGNADFLSFLQLAQQIGFDVILRPGPYICAEWENGGLPWWLLKVRNIKLRTSHPTYMLYVKQWMSKLLPMIRAYLYKNGGPIIMVQIENEYGSFQACDRTYMRTLNNIFRTYLGDDTVVLFTVDGSSSNFLKCGTTPGAYPTVDFGPTGREGTKFAFYVQRKYAPKGPLVNTEFYPGWLDVWGKDHSVTPSGPILDTMSYMWSFNASFTFYMFTGGTNFGDMNCASAENRPVTTSYDYDAPISEAGDPTTKLFAIRSQIEKLTGKQITIPVPPAQPKFAYGKIPAYYFTDVLTVARAICPNAKHYISPPTFEDLDSPYGYIMYSTVVPFYGTLEVLVENLGRTCFGYSDLKGLLGGVLLDGQMLIDWKACPINFDDIYERIKNHTIRKTKSKNYRSSSRSFIPAIYYAKFQTYHLADTFFYPKDWKKGHLYMNKFNVGRYWPEVGPQVTLYVPRNLLRNENEILILETEGTDACEYTLISCVASLEDG
ncbi:unnamed protein product, partial [Soboliphyme baturini]|uniref:Glyco_hydro_35 domain-containing protein n=1 Tax=Soboliphyme baturini TaxID=241478 RepID=A0A183IYE1_9BILA